MSPLLARLPARSSSPAPSEVPERPFALDLLARALPRDVLAQLAPAASGVPEPLWERALLGPVREILARPGKGFRRMLVDLSYRVAGGHGAAPAELGAVLEILHAGSLVVDDVEDGSQTRRGGPAVHVLHGVPLAINAGNWMYFWPFELVGQLGLPPARELAIRDRMSRTLWECHMGQALDLGARLDQVPQRRVCDVVETITTLKTGRLMELGAVLGALAAGGSSRVVEALGAFGCDLGVGLQMLDDLGNLGKGTDPEKRHEDLRNGRVTWAWAWAAELCDEADYARLVSLAGATDARASALDRLAGELRSAVGSHGKLQAHWHLERALGALRTAAGPAMSGAAAAVEREIERLEVSYG